MSTKGSQNGEAMSVPSQLGNDIAINSWKLNKLACLRTKMR